MNVLVRPFDPLNSHRLSHGQPKRQQQGAAHGRLQAAASFSSESTAVVHAVRPFRRAPSDVQRQDLDFPTDAARVAGSPFGVCLRWSVPFQGPVAQPLRSFTGRPFRHTTFTMRFSGRRGIGASRFTISVPQQQRTVGSEHAGSGARLVDGMDQIRKASAATSA